VGAGGGGDDEEMLPREESVADLAAKVWVEGLWGLEGEIFKAEVILHQTDLPERGRTVSCRARVGDRLRRGRGSRGKPPGN